MSLSNLLHIRPRMILFFLLTGILPILMIGYLGTNLAEKILLKKSFEQLQSVQSIRINQIADGFSDRLKNLRMLTKYDILGDTFDNLEKYRTLSQLSPEEDMDISSQEYSELTGKIHAMMREFITTYMYQDFYLISSRHGHIMLSVGQGPDLGTSLEYGKYKNSGLADLWKKIMETGEMALTDFLPYAPSGGEQSAFLGIPLYSEEGVLQGIAAFQLGTDFISDLLDSRLGMGETGESYLLRWFRKDNIFSLRSEIFSMGMVIGDTLPSNMIYWEDAVKAGTEGGRGSYNDSLNHKVLVAYSSINFKDLDWYLISKIDEKEVLLPLRELILDIIGVAVTLIIMIIFLAVNIAGNLTGPILMSKEFAWKITHGNLKEVLHFENRKDELGELGESLNTMARTIREISWQRAGREELNNALRVESELKQLCDRITSFFVRYCNAEMGAIYLQEEEDKEILALTSGYAFSGRGGDFDRIRFGEGLIGQAALETEPIHFSDVTEGMPSLDYGVSEKIPPHFIISPLIHKQNILGVFFIASMTPFTEDRKQFIRQNLGIAAAQINTAKSRNLINTLLHQAQERQEELRVINEELEAQTQALKESESELQAQQEELRVANEELEERTQALEEQTNSVSEKNAELIVAHREIEQKAKDLEAANQYKTEFLANMSHELRTPLNSILILSQLLSKNREENLTDKQVESAKAVYSSGADLLKLINEILDLSKVEAGKIEISPEETTFKSIVADLQRVFRDLAKEKDIRFDIRIDEKAPPTLYTDPHRLQQILRNLLTNAFKFTEKRGNVRITVEEPSEEIAYACGLEKTESVAIHVEDNGIGIPEDKQDAVFNAFQQADGSTSRKYGGTGLGLSICRELTKLLGGSLKLSSQVGQGSTFSVVLPKRYNGGEGPREDSVIEQLPLSSPQEPEPESRKAEEVKEKSYKKEIHDDRQSLFPDDKSLLIIEDDPKFAQILKDLAAERGFKCLVAEDGETGLHFADYYKPKAIILDVRLPGIDGWTVMERLKEDPQLRHIPVHFMSGSENSMEAMRMGAIGYLTKPVSIEKVESALGKIEKLISRSVKKLLIVEDDAIQRASIAQLIGNGDVQSLSVGSGQEAFEKLQSEPFDCMILDLGLEDMSGFDLLEKIRGEEYLSLLPIIIYTGRDLTRADEEKLRKYSESIIIKGVKSPERLLDESALFLHRIESQLPPEKQKILNMIHDQNAVFQEKKILLTDDDMRNVFALTSVLEEKNMEVVIAKNGLESLQRLKEHSDVNLILMDIMMPEMDGYEAIKAIRKEPRFKKIPIIALTAKAMKGDRNKCIEAGATDYLAKPVNTDKLLSMLKVWLHK